MKKHIKSIAFIFSLVACFPKKNKIDIESTPPTVPEFKLPTVISFDQYVEDEAIREPQEVTKKDRSSDYKYFYTGSFALKIDEPIRFSIADYKLGYICKSKSSPVYFELLDFPENKKTILLTSDVIRNPEIALTNIQEFSNTKIEKGEDYLLIWRLYTAEKCDKAIKLSLKATKQSVR
ncbi:MAG: hypothetical protein KBD78_06805 [Oligoflexales bacterium]|nr:hypothetical protein [Oligoflexales bacterium]